MNGLKVDKEQFSTFDQSAQNTILFENLSANTEKLDKVLSLLDTKEINCQQQIQSCTEHFLQIEKKVSGAKVVDRVVSAITGATTAVLAIFGKDKFF